jgi:hypothetical protein
MAVPSVRLLRRAAEVVGGRSELAHYLGLPRRQLDDYLHGKVLPDYLLLRSLDLVLDSQIFSETVNALKSRSAGSDAVASRR